MRLAPLALSVTMTVVCWLIPHVARAQLAAEIGPRGEITRLSAATWFRAEFAPPN